MSNDPYPAKYTSEPAKRKTPKSAFLRKLEKQQREEAESRAPVVNIREKRKVKA